MRIATFKRAVASVMATIMMVTSLPLTAFAAPAETRAAKNYAMVRGIKQGQLVASVNMTNPVESKNGMAVGEKTYIEFWAIDSAEGGSIMLYNENGTPLGPIMGIRYHDHVKGNTTSGFKATITDRNQIISNLKSLAQTASAASYRGMGSIPIIGCEGKPAPVERSISKAAAQAAELTENESENKDTEITDNNDTQNSESTVSDVVSEFEQSQPETPAAASENAESDPEEQPVSSAVEEIAESSIEEESGALLLAETEDTSVQVEAAESQAEETASEAENSELENLPASENEQNDQSESADSYEEAEEIVSSAPLSEEQNSTQEPVQEENQPVESKPAAEEPVQSDAEQAPAEDPNDPAYSQYSQPNLKII